MAILAILSRWIHVVTACVAVGGVFFIRFILPAGLAILPEDQRKPVFLKIRRVFKMVIHTSILLLLITGIFNSSLVLNVYNRNPALMHPLWGTHILLALIAFCIALVLLSGPEPRKSHKKWTAINFVVLLLAIATASTLKWAREQAMIKGNPAPTQVSENP